MEPLLPITYFGNIEYFWHLSTVKNVQFYIGETYKKQTFRNRCIVLGANGSLNLSVPVERPHGQSSKTADVLISEAENWRKTHWKTIESCYNRTPYFEFYADALKLLLFEENKTLATLCLNLTEHLIKKIGLVSNFEIVNELDFDADLKLQDNFSPKKNSSFKVHPYLQTFTERYGFTNNLSILDLLFNEGPNTICILNESKYEH